MEKQKRKGGAMKVMIAIPGWFLPVIAILIFMAGIGLGAVADLIWWTLTGQSI